PWPKTFTQRWSRFTRVKPARIREALGRQDRRELDRSHILHLMEAQTEVRARAASPAPAARRRGSKISAAEKEARWVKRARDFTTRRATRAQSEPAAAASPEAQADWLELLALQSDGNSSFHDLTRVLRRSGTTDALGDPFDSGGEGTEVLASDAFAELDERYRACGGEQGAYPFEVGEQSITL